VNLFFFETPRWAEIHSRARGLSSRRNVQFIDIDRPFNLWPRRVQRFLRALEAPVDCPVGDSEFRVQLSDARIQPDMDLDGQIPLSERNRRGLENRAGLVVELPAAILT